MQTGYLYMPDSAKNIHKKTFEIMWRDIDSLGHLNHARIFDYFQECRIEWLAELGFTLKEPTGPIVVKISCTYLKPLLHPTTIDIISKIHSFGRSSFVIDHLAYENGELVAEGICKFVWVDYEKNKSIPYPAVIGALNDNPTI